MNRKANKKAPKQQELPLKIPKEASDENAEGQEVRQLTGRLVTLYFCNAVLQRLAEEAARSGSAIPGTETLTQLAFWGTETHIRSMSDRLKTLIYGSPALSRISQSEGEHLDSFAEVLDDLLNDYF